MMNRMRLSGELDQFRERSSVTTVAGVYFVDIKNGPVQEFKLMGNTKFVVPLASPECESFTLIIDCNTFTPTWGGGTVEWLTFDGTPPDLSPLTAGLVRVIGFLKQPSKPRFLGFLSGKEV